MSDFFAIRHETFAPVNSAVVVDNPTSSMNCYWPMPFRKHARITFTNDSDKNLPLLTFQIDYEAGAVPQDAGYFHGGAEVVIQWLILLNGLPAQVRSQSGASC
jgi:hypothetical protein